MDRKELIKKYIEFFKSKSHREIFNSSLIPENDPTVLFTTAGMHPLVPYLLGQPHPLGKRLCNVQRCIRTGDIDEVGDETHHTFFEMLGNWSLGDYWKKEAIEYTFEFITKILEIPAGKIGVSCFGGDKDAPKDIESFEIWKSLGIPEERIAFLGKKDNWWGPAGKTGPCGPDTEIFYWKSNEIPVPEKFDPEDKNWVEIGNNVLMEYKKDEHGNYREADQKNIDFGGGVERIVSTLLGFEDDYLAPYFSPIIRLIEDISGMSYSKNKKTTRAMRIIADHIKASVMIIADGVVPSNSERGYVIRRLIRRAIRYGRNLKLKKFVRQVAEPVFKIYDDYNHLHANETFILDELEKEEERFLKTLEKGMSFFSKIVKGKKRLSGKDAFLLYQSYGFPLEMILEIAKEKRIEVDVKAYKEEERKHQELSRTATEGKFKSGLADKGVETTRYHTATHLLHAALRKVLGDNVQQKGSNITAERLRFDFAFERKLSEEEKEKVEKIVNEAIKKDFPVLKEEMSPEDAKKSGALGFFEHKYGGKVSVYTIGKGKKIFSREICTGPHVKSTGELGKFRIKKEESSSAGVRRIKAILE
jgi:alanyl-tRNA synthetase